MIATLEHVRILDRTERLVSVVMQSETMQEYIYKRNELNQDKEAQDLIQRFNDLKSHYEDVQRFGRYHPDYNKIMTDVRSAKRKMDMHPTVSAFKIAERSLQKLLDDISEHIAAGASEQIMVPKDGAAWADSGCAGGCGSGGACSCSA